MIAINVSDLSNFGNMAGIMLADYCSATSPITNCEPGRIDGGAVVLDGPAAQDGSRLDALVALLVTGPYARRLGRSVRVYTQGLRGGWRKIK